MIPFMNTVASMMTTGHLFVADILFMSPHVSPSTLDSLSACLYFIFYLSDFYSFVFPDRERLNRGKSYFMAFTR